MSNFDENIYRLRKRDAVTGVLLIVLAVAMGAKALTYPLNESYAGVENAWYASPAFFPLIVSGLILILALILLSTAINYIMKFRTEKNAAVLPSDNEKGQLFHIMGLLVSFIYLYIPSTDFLIAGIFFLTIFIGLYTIPQALPKMKLILIYILLGIVLRITYSLFATDNWTVQYIRDYSVTFFYILFLIFTFISVKKNYGNRKKWLLVFLSGGIFMIFLVFSFKLGLRIPMPREGYYCYKIDVLF